MPGVLSPSSWSNANASAMRRWATLAVRIWRRDCVQVVNALSVTPDGFPQTYEVMPGNTLDNGTPDDETREKRIEGPPLPSASGPTAGFAQPAGCGGAPRAVRNLASPSHGEASNGQIASLDCHPSL